MTCKRCATEIPDRFPSFRICTPCAIKENEEALIPWRAAEALRLRELREKKRREALERGA